MDIERLNRLLSRWITWLRTGHLRDALAGRMRMSRRTMIMDYLYFFGSVMAIGLIAGLIWRPHFMGDKALSLREYSRKGRASAPPLKKTISGLTEKELEHIEFQNRIDAWQRGHEVRRENFKQASVPVNGQKYEFIPTRRNIPRKRPSRIQTRRVPQQFQLLN